jgi:hypothetical protein
VGLVQRDTEHARYAWPDDSVDEAWSVSVALVRQDERLRAGTMNERDDSPMIYLESMSGLDSFEDRDVPDSGYTWGLRP